MKLLIAIAILMHMTCIAIEGPTGPAREDYPHYPPAGANGPAEPKS